MKKQITLFICNIVFIFFGIAQPLTGNNYETFEKNPNLFKASPQKGDFLLEPDTIYLYSVNGLIERRIFLYENNVCVVDLTQKWINNQWNNSVKTSYSFDSQNNLIEELIQDYNGTWKNRNKKFYIYDKRNYLIETLLLKWEYGYYNYYWKNYMKETYTYDTLNHLKEKLEYIYTSGGWRFQYGYEYTYDTFNNLIKMREKIWYPIDEYWIPTDEFHYYYDKNNNLVEILKGDVGYWKTRKTILYDTLNYVVSVLAQKWQTNEWVNCEIETYAYDSQYNMTEKLYQHWNEQWEDYERHLYSYDENNNATVGYAQKWVNNQWIDVNSTLEIYYHNMQNFYSVNAHKFIITYNDPKNIGNSVSNLPNNSVNVYPNPVSNVLYIETDNANQTPEIKIFSIHGFLLIHTKETQIDVSSLTRGIYIVEINGLTTKILKQ